MTDKSSHVVKVVSVGVVFLALRSWQFICVRTLPEAALISAKNYLIKRVAIQPALT